MKLWRGEQMCLIGFDVPAPAPADLVGFAIERRAPGRRKFEPLKNRLAFSYDEPIARAVTGARKYPSTQAVPEVPLGRLPVRATGGQVRLSRNDDAHAVRRQA
jgi:hypothetical protein